MLDLTTGACLTDFGSARSANVDQHGWWMPDTYRAPEILMGVEWGCQVDVWSIGIMVSLVGSAETANPKSTLLTFHRLSN
jgi:serine/threonine protein kinase